MQMTLSLQRRIPRLLAQVSGLRDKMSNVQEAWSALVTASEQRPPESAAFAKSWPAVEWAMGLWLPTFDSEADSTPRHIVQSVESGAPQYLRPTVAASRCLANLLPCLLPTQLSPSSTE